MSERGLPPWRAGPGVPLAVNSARNCTCRSASGSASTMIRRLRRRPDVGRTPARSSASAAPGLTANQAREAPRIELRPSSVVAQTRTRRHRSWPASVMVPGCKVVRSAMSSVSIERWATDPDAKHRTQLQIAQVHLDARTAARQTVPAASVRSPYTRRRTSRRSCEARRPILQPRVSPRRGAAECGSSPRQTPRRRPSTDLGRNEPASQPMFRLGQQLGVSLPRTLEGSTSGRRLTTARRRAGCVTVPPPTAVPGLRFQVQRDQDCVGHRARGTASVLSLAGSNMTKPRLGRTCERYRQAEDLADDCSPTGRQGNSGCPSARLSSGATGTELGQLACWSRIAKAVATSAHWSPVEDLTRTER